MIHLRERDSRSRNILGRASDSRRTNSVSEWSYIEQTHWLILRPLRPVEFTRVDRHGQPDDSNVRSRSRGRSAHVSFAHVLEPVLARPPADHLNRVFSSLLAD